MKSIITNKKKLKKKCKPVKNLKEGLHLGELLLKILLRHPGAIGLAANQIGINKRVCVVNVSKKIILVNPRIISKFKKIKFQEGCYHFLVIML